MFLLLTEIKKKSIEMKLTRNKTNKVTSAKTLLKLKIQLKT